MSNRARSLGAAGAVALRVVVGDLWSVLLPAVCRECGGAADEGAWAPLLCIPCGRRLPAWDRPVPVPGPLDGAWALWLYEGAARRLIRALKYDGVRRAGRLVGSRMAEAARGGRLLRASDVVVPVALHPRRRWRRGYNQAAVLARGLTGGGRHVSLPRAGAGPAGGCRPPVMATLRRTRATPPQTGLDREERLRNVAGAFAVRRAAVPRVCGRRVLLVDDVVTTGSTAAAAAQALEQAGAERVRLYAACWSR